MKKVIVATILGLTAAVVTVQAQSFIQLYNDETLSMGSVTYNGVPVSSSLGCTVGFYYAVGDIAASVNTLIGGATTAGNGNAGSLAGAGLTLATGQGSTAFLGSDGPGVYDSVYTFVFSGTPAGTTVTIVLAGYKLSDGSYESSSFRGHSAAFTMTTTTGSVFEARTGDYAGPFAIVPEPTTFALACVGIGSLWVWRRLKSDT